MQSIAITGRFWPGPSPPQRKRSAAETKQDVEVSDGCSGSDDDDGLFTPKRRACLPLPCDPYATQRKRKPAETNTQTQPTPRSQAQSTPHAQAQPTPRAQAQPTPRAQAQPTPHVQTQPTPHAQLTPRAQAQPTPQPESAESRQARCAKLIQQVVGWEAYLQKVEGDICAEEKKLRELPPKFPFGGLGSFALMCHSDVRCKAPSLSDASPLVNGAELLFCIASLRRIPSKYKKWVAECATSRAADWRDFKNVFGAALGSNEHNYRVNHFHAVFAALPAALPFDLVTIQVRNGPLISLPACVAFAIFEGGSRDVIQNSLPCADELTPRQWFEARAKRLHRHERTRFRLYYQGTRTDFLITDPAHRQEFTRITAEQKALEDMLV